MRCFFGIPVENSEDLAEAQNSLLSYGVRLIPRENLHITFIFLGEIGEHTVDRMCASLRSVSFKRPHVKTEKIIGLPHYKKARVIALKLDCPELTSYYNEFSKRVGFVESRKYLPHITLARSRKPVSIQPAEVFLPDEIEVNRITLFRSILNSEGAIYNELCSSQLI